jgi:hypothetical protein
MEITVNNKKFLNYALILIILALTVLTLISCGEPSPLHGTWADNRGNTFTFFTDDTFNISITVSGMPMQNYSGSYIVLMNILTLESDEVELRIVTEWDIRGNILYLNWPSELGNVALTLFKISN